MLSRTSYVAAEPGADDTVVHDDDDSRFPKYHQYVAQYIDVACLFITTGMIPL